MTDFCHCGSVENATHAAERLFVEMASTDCAIWALQVATILRSIAIDAISDDGQEPIFTRRMAQERVNEIIAASRESRRPIEDMRKAVAERRDDLYGGLV